MNEKTLVVLAAGMGSRYGGLKQIDPVGPSNESLLDYSIYDACAAGFGRVVFVIRRDIEQEFREKIGNVDDFLRSPVPAITPVDFLSRFPAYSIQEASASRLRKQGQRTARHAIPTSFCFSTISQTDSSLSRRSSNNRTCSA